MVWGQRVDWSVPAASKAAKKLISNIRIYHPIIDLKWAEQLFIFAFRLDQDLKNRDA
jgi:hypothetical protein